MIIFSRKEVYRDMGEWIRIRQRVLREGVSKRQILRETGMHWTTLEKILKYPSPPGYCRTQPPKKLKIDPYVERIRQILEQDKHMPKKQRHTANARISCQKILFLEAILYEKVLGFTYFRYSDCVYSSK